MAVNDEFPLDPTHPLPFYGHYVSSLCSYLPRPLILIGLLRHILVQHFSHADLIEAPELKELLWKPDSTQTKIIIEPEWHFHIDDVHARPAIILRQGATQPGNPLSIGHREQGGGQIRDGADHFARLPSTQLTMRVLAEDAVAVQTVAWEAFAEIVWFSDVIARGTRLNRLDWTGTVEARQLEEYAENWVVDVNLIAIYNLTYRVNMERPPLQAVRVDTIITG